jgi:fructose-1,6-bisphosphatase/inositol monophosphatase family enzyme
MEDKYKFTIDLLNEASDFFLKNNSGKISIKNNDVRNILSELDVKLNNFLKNRISEKYPEDSIYSEEDETWRGRP